MQKLLFRVVRTILVVNSSFWLIKWRMKLDAKYGKCLNGVNCCSEVTSTRILSKLSSFLDRLQFLLLVLDNVWLLRILLGWGEFRLFFQLLFKILFLFCYWFCSCSDCIRKCIVWKCYKFFLSKLLTYKWFFVILIIFSLT